MAQQAETRDSAGFVSCYRSPRDAKPLGKLALSEPEFLSNLTVDALTLTLSLKGKGN